jgi:uncharacterized protein
MWKRLAEFVIKYRLVLLISLAAASGFMAWKASRVKLSYEFAKAIPTDNPRYIEYIQFKERFGDEGNLMVIGIQSEKVFQLDVFNQITSLQNQLKKVQYVEDALSFSSAVNLVKDSATEKLLAQPIFNHPVSQQSQIDSGRAVLVSLPFYRTLLYNPETNAYIIAVTINKERLNSPARTKIIGDINALTDSFTTRTGIETHLSGLPLIRTKIADRVAAEMRWFIIGSLLLSTLILVLFFRSFSTTMLSLAVVILGVVWSFGILELFGYRITILNALIPPLVVVIGIPNCIYFLNKYHTSYLSTKDKNGSLVDMVSKMGIVTLFCNITAAIGFAVFALTESAVLKEFGAVAGISIMVIFVISFILLPAVLSYLPAPTKGQTKYLDTKWLTAILEKLEQWAIHHKRVVYGSTAVVVAISIVGIMRLESRAFIVDDLPKTDKIYTDLKFFEKNFRGIMPLDIVIDSRKRGGLSGSRLLPVLERIDSLSQFITQQPEMARPLSIAEGLKFVKQAIYEGDTNNYMIPSTSDAAIFSDYLRPQKDTGGKTGLSKMMTNFIDTARQSTRISINMADVGTQALPVLLDKIKKRADELFDTSKYKVTLTGTSITFLEGSKFIIDGLKESILWAFGLIALCMLYLFRSFRILLCSLIPNVIPLLVTAGIMGWAGIPLRPSTVLVFSVALGIAIDVTIRFLVNYKQELGIYKNDVLQTVTQTIRHTGLSIMYTSMVLVAGFVIFCFSSFGGTQALGWLTSVTLLVATLTNLVLLPVLLLSFAPNHKGIKNPAVQG